MKKYWPELLALGILLAVYLIDLSPDFTWINTNSDGVHLVYASKYLYISHKTSVPLYLLLGNLFMRIPLGTEYWRLGLLSVIGSTGAAIFIYFIIRAKLQHLIEKKQRLYALIGVLIWGGSALVLSQTVIAEDYMLMHCFGIGAYYFSVVKKWKLSALFLALGMATHLVTGFYILPILFFNKEMRRVKPLLVMSTFLLAYLYIPFSKYVMQSPNMWGNDTVGSFLNDNISTILMLSGNLAIWDLPKRIFETLGILGVSLGLAVVPITWYFIKEKKLLRNELFWLFSLITVYFMMNLAIQTFVYMIPTIAFGAIITGIMLPRMRPYWAVSVVVIALLLLGYHANYFDVGRTLDPELSASRYVREELNKVPDGDILMPQYGWEWAAIYYYNEVNDRNIIPVSIGTLPSADYQQILRDGGINLDSYEDEPVGRMSILIARSILDMNEGNIWTTKPTTPETYGSEIVLASEYPGIFDLSELDKYDYDERSYFNGWAFRPSNPYGIITGAVEVEEWVFINDTKGTRSVLFFIQWGTFGYAIYWLIKRLVLKSSRKMMESNYEKT